MFRGPFDVDLSTARTLWTPEQFQRHAPYMPVPARLTTLRVITAAQPEPGMAASGHAFCEGPDTEFIAGGDNGNSHRHVAIGRHGKFVQWGYSASADNLTPTGAALLCNVIVYASGLADEQVHVLRYAKPRTLLLGSGLDLAQDRNTGPATQCVSPQSLRDIWGDTPPAGTDGDLDSRRTFWNENHGYLTYTGTIARGHYHLDEDAKSWGIANDDIALLHRCLDALITGQDTERATRLWTRYTGRPVEDLETERLWLAQNKEALYFSKWAGYRWQSSREPHPRGYPHHPRHTDRVRADLYAVSIAPGRARITVDILVEPGWYVYAPGSTEGIPVRLSVDSKGEHAIEDVRCPEGSDGLLSGQFQIETDLTTTDSVLAVRLTAQPCTKIMCEPPREVWLTTTVVSANERSAPQVA